MSDKNQHLESVATPREWQNIITSSMTDDGRRIRTTDDGRRIGGLYGI